MMRRRGNVPVSGGYVALIPVTQIVTSEQVTAKVTLVLVLTLMMFPRGLAARNACLAQDFSDLRPMAMYFGHQAGGLK
jgi:hypothetical protein